MLISQQTRHKPARGQGCPPGGLAELRSQLAKPSAVSDGSRQRLLNLSRRLAAVQALGDDFARVDFSPFAAEALGRHAEMA
ncbi:MAG: hypothetical protein GXY38_06590 [Planctomycetes bacterium]|jgi:hypothetical protein|nr:hypothetical protein [Planctomycetota bacterium]